MRLYMYLCTYLCVFVCICNVCLCLWVYRCVCLCVSVCVFFMCVFVPLHVSMNVYPRVSRHVYVCVRVCAHARWPLEQLWAGSPMVGSLLTESDSEKLHRG